MEREVGDSHWALCPFPSKCSIFHLGSQKIHRWDVELPLAGSTLCLLWDVGSCPFCLLSCFTRQNFFFTQKSFLWKETIGTHFRSSTELKKQVDGCLPKVKCTVCSKTFCFNFTQICACKVNQLFWCKTFEHY